MIVYNMEGEKFFSKENYYHNSIMFISNNNLTIINIIVTETDDLYEI